MSQMIFRIHAIRRMFERSISLAAVESVLKAGDVIEEYPDDKPFPSCLLLGIVEGRPIHIVAADDGENQVTIIMAVYEPDPSGWIDGFKRKRS